MDVALGVDFLEQLLAVTLVVPGQVRRRLHVERRAGVQRQGRNGALVVADPGVAGRVLAAAHRIHDLERRHQFARLVVAQLDVAARDGLERFGKVLDRRGQADQVGGEGQRHLPADLLRGTGDATEQAGAEQGGGTDGAGDTGKLVLGRHADFPSCCCSVPEGGRVTARGSRALTGQNKNRGRADAADPAPVLFFGLFWRRGVDCRFCAYRPRTRKGARCSAIGVIAGRWRCPLRQTLPGWICGSVRNSGTCPFIWTAR